MTRAELRILSRCHAVAALALAAAETGHVPLAAAAALAEDVPAGLPALAGDCARFHADLRAAHGDARRVRRAGQVFRDAVRGALAFRPVDAGRVDIHG